MADFSLEQFLNVSDDVFSIPEDNSLDTTQDASSKTDKAENDDVKVDNDTDNDPIVIDESTIDSSDTDKNDGVGNTPKDSDSTKVDTKTVSTEDKETFKKDDSTNDSDSKEESKDSSDIYTQYYNILKDNEFLATSDDFKFEGTPESLAEAIDQSKHNLRKHTALEIMQNLPDDFKPLFQYALSGGDNLQKYLDTYKEVSIEDVELKGQVENQKYVLKEYFKRTANYSDDKIDRMIERIHTAGELENEAISALSELKEIGAEERQKLIQETEAQKAKALEQATEFRNNLNKNISESEFIQDKRKSKVKAFLFNSQKFGEEQDTQFNHVLKQIASKPEHLIQLADLLLDYDNKKGFTLDRFTRRAATKGAQTLKDQLQSITTNNRNNVSGGTSVTVNNTEDFPWDAFLEQDF